MIKATSVKVNFPKKVSVSKEQKEQLERSLLIKKLKKYGYFDNSGKWKEK